MSYTERIIVLVDMDCFYCQVEENLDPNLKGKPIAVVQYNTWRGGGIIAVNYPAREKGVTRHMRGNEAKQICPEIILARVPEVRGKADLTKYREAGKKVADVLQLFTPTLERASVDEAYLDISEVVKKRIMDISQIHQSELQNTYVVGYDVKDFLYNVTQNRDYSESNFKLAVGGLIAEEIRAEVYKQTGYKCSAGIAHNKILAKLVCGLHKPNKQTILPQESVSELYKELPIRKVPGFGGKFGATLSDKLKISKFGELITYTEKQLMKHFEEKTAKWLYNIARGIDYEPVTPRLISKSIGCCKKFSGKSALVTPESVEHWINELTSEISERLKKDAIDNNRRAKQMTIHFAEFINNKDVSKSRTLPLKSYDQPIIAQIGLEALKKYCMKSDGTYYITYLGLSVGNFVTNKNVTNISDIFKSMRDFELQKKVSLNNFNTEELDLLPQTTSSECNQLLLSTATKNSDTISEQKDEFLGSKLLDENKIFPYDQETSFLKENKLESNVYHEDNTSIYSAETDDLNEDTKSLIYYEDIYPENVASQPIFNKSQEVTNYVGDKSTVNEMIVENDNCDLFSNRSSSSTSFFSKFFENYNTHDNITVSEVERDFDTSKILRDELESSDEILEFYEPIHEDKIEAIPAKSQTEYEHQETKQAVNSMETCPECKKIISQREFEAHMDYHYALNIVKDEAHIYKPTLITTSSKKQCNKKESAHNSKQGIKKRTVDTKPIHTYLQINDFNQENSELCTECNKRIKLEDISSHADYHVAKKLHSEINTKSWTKSNIEPLNKTCVKSKKKKGIKSAGNITSFLNRSGV